MIIVSILDLAERRCACRWTLFATALVLMLLMQGICLRDKVLRVDAGEYASEATELRVSLHWRYGYIKTLHGARLVRTPNVSPPVSPSHPASHLWVAMNNELRLVPLKAAGETALYLLLLIYGFFAAPWMATGAPAQTGGRISNAVYVGLLWSAGWTILAVPVLIWGYGEPIYSTWSGPGALSSSGPYMCSLSSGPGLTVSYRIVFEVGAPCIVARMVESSGLAEHLPEMRVAVYLWLLGYLSYWTMGSLWQLAIRGALLPRDALICPTCHIYVEPKALLEPVARRCSCGRIASMAYSFVGSFFIGLATCTGWFLLGAALLDATDLHGITRIVIGALLLLSVVAYSAMEVWSGLQYRKAPYPTKRLTRTHFGVGLGVLSFPVMGLISFLLL